MKHTYIDQLISYCNEVKTSDYKNQHSFIIDDVSDIDFSVFDILKSYKFVLYTITELDGDSETTYKQMKNKKMIN